MNDRFNVSGTMTADEIVALCRRHTLFDWSVQSAVQPIAVKSARGAYFWSWDGQRYLDFNSQLMCVNIGHSDERVVRAIAEQAAKLPYLSPALASEPRARLGLMLSQISPGDIDTFFFTNGGAESNEHAVKIARMYTGRQKILARYRSYHGATLGAITLTGDSRRWAAEPGIPGVVHVLDPYHGLERGWETTESSLETLEEIIQLEGPHTIAAFILESISGANGVLVPPDGYLQGVRRLCTKYGILMICDEVMSGFGRTGEWFAVDHWNVVPDIITLAKGITSAYVQLGAVGMRREIAEHFRDRMFASGLTYNSHPLACAAAVATLNVYLEDNLIDNAKRQGVTMQRLQREVSAAHACVGGGRSLGLFGALDLVQTHGGRPSRTQPLPDKDVGRVLMELRKDGLYTMARGHTLFTCPPLCITEDELRSGFEIIKRALARLEFTAE